MSRTISAPRGAHKHGGQVLLTASLVLFSSVAGAVAQAPSYHLVKSHVLGSPRTVGSLNPSDKAGKIRVFVAHGDRVAVVDAKAGAV